MTSCAEVSPSFLRSLQETFASSKLYLHGRGWGREQAAWLRSRARDEALVAGSRGLLMKSALSWWSARLAAEGWGLARFDLSEISQGEIHAEIAESALAISAIDSADGKSACALLAGQFAGAFESLSQRSLSCIEIACRASGDDRCRFLIGPIRTIDAELYWKREGIALENLHMTALSKDASSEADRESKSETETETKTEEGAIHLSDAFWKGFAADEDATDLRACGRHWSGSWARQLDLEFREARKAESVVDASPGAFEAFLIEALRRSGWGEFAIDHSLVEQGIVQLTTRSLQSPAAHWILEGAFAGVFSRFSRTELECVGSRNCRDDEPSRFWIAAADRIRKIREELAGDVASSGDGEPLARVF